MQKSNFCDYLIEVPLSISSTTFQQNIGIFRYLATVRPDPLSPLPITHTALPLPPTTITATSRGTASNYQNKGP